MENVQALYLRKNSEEEYDWGYVVDTRSSRKK